MINIYIPNNYLKPEVLYTISTVMKYFTGVYEYNLVPCFKKSQVEININGWCIKFKKTLSFNYTPENYSYTSPIIDWEPITPEFLNDRYDQIPVANLDNSKDMIEFAQESKVCNINFDFWGLIFIMLSRLEEIRGRPEDVDRHGRSKSEKSLSSKNGFLGIPVVDVYCDILSAIFVYIAPQLPIYEKSYRAYLSHDIDMPFFYGEGGFRRFAAKFYRRCQQRNLVDAASKFILDIASTAIEVNDPYEKSFDWLLNLYRQQCKTAAFYIPTACSIPNNPRFNYRSLRFSKIVQSLEIGGHEIGFHPGYNTMTDASRWDQELLRFKSYIKSSRVHGGRQHFLQFDILKTWYFWEANGFSYDSSLGYADSVGYRCGTSREYPLFDFHKRQETALLERPLIAMDVTLFRNCYMGLNLADIYSSVNRLISQSKYHKSNFVLNWHSFNLDTEEKKELYSEIVKVL